MTELFIGLLLGASGCRLAYRHGVEQGARLSLTEVLRARAEAANARQAVQAITRDAFVKLVERAEARQFGPRP